MSFDLGVLDLSDKANKNDITEKSEEMQENRFKALMWNS
jgi:hypothetical protein